MQQCTCGSFTTISIIKITYWNIICTDVYCCLAFFSLTIPLGNSYNAYYNIGSLLSCTHAHTWDTSSFGPQALHCLVVFGQVSVSVYRHTIVVHGYSLIDFQQGSMACLLLESLCCLYVERQSICFPTHHLWHQVHLWLLYFDVFLRSSFTIFTAHNYQLHQLSFDKLQHIFS